MVEGRVIKIVSNIFTVSTIDCVVECKARGNIKQTGSIFVGDIVSLDELNNEYVITKVLKRRNEMVRPPISNIDQLIIVVSPIPKPDLLLVDKLIIYCYQNNITPVIVINKCDISSAQFIQDIMSQYRSSTKTIVATSATNNVGLEALLDIFKDKVSALAGQSAVGKSTLINALIPQQNVITGEVSRINRGRNTTRTTSMYKIDNTSFLVDTAGFSMLKLAKMNPDELYLYYPEFFEIPKCKYSTCNHIGTTKNDCSVVNLVEAGKINSERYSRYVKLYNELKKEWNNYA